MDELHDGLGSCLFTALARAERGALHSAEMAQLLRECIAELRLALEMEAAPAGAIEPRLNAFRARWHVLLADAGVALDWRQAVQAQALAVAELAELLRVAQEALTNVLRHAQATQVRLVLTADGTGAFDLCVDDNGVGWPADPSVPDAPEARSTVLGHGLASMQRRAQRLQAELHLLPLSPGSRVRLSRSSLVPKIA